jgi:hypothetical protein
MPVQLCMTLFGLLTSGKSIAFDSPLGCCTVMQDDGMLFHQTFNRHAV